MHVIGSTDMLLENGCDHFHMLFILLFINLLVLARHSTCSELSTSFNTVQCISVSEAVRHWTCYCFILVMSECGVTMTVLDMTSS